MVWRGNLGGAGAKNKKGGNVQKVIQRSDERIDEGINRRFSEGIGGRLDEGIDGRVSEGLNVRRCQDQHGCHWSD